MRRRRVPVRRAVAPPALRRDASDLAYLEQVVALRFPVRHAREYLTRQMANPVRVRLVEAQRGEAVGTVRAVEIRHAGGGASLVSGLRRLPDGQPASQYVPEHLVQILPHVGGLAAESRSLAVDDEVVLHVPVRGLLRFLPAIYQGEGPVRARLDDETAVAEAAEADDLPLRRFLFVFQHLWTPLLERIEDLSHLTDPARVDPRFLPWLASWVGFDLDGSLPVDQQRELVRRAIRLMRTRGTRAGIEEMVRVLTAAPVRIEERRPPRPVVLGRTHLGGGPTVEARYRRGENEGSYLGSGEDPRARRTGFFTLRLEPRSRFAERFGERAPDVLERIVRVVSAERPGHLRFVLRFDDQLE